MSRRSGIRGYDEYHYPQRRHNSWHIEKGVSISLVVFLIIQTVSIIWFAAQLTGQVKQNTADIANLQVEEKDREKQRAEVIANLSSINQELRDMREIMFQSAGRATHGDALSRKRRAGNNKYRAGPYKRSFAGASAKLGE